MNVRVKVDTRQFDRAIREYARVRRMDMAHALERSAKKFCFRLAEGYSRVAATAEKIASEAAQRNWFTLIHRGPYAGKVIRTPVAVVDAELARRARAARFLAVSFFFRSWRVSRDGVRRLFTKTSGKSRVFVDTAATSPRIVVASDLAGVVAMDKQHGIWNRALVEETADLNAYLQRKEREAAAVFNRR